MIKYTLKIDGMKCGMCESHVNDIIRKTVKVKSVTSSHSKNETVVIVNDNIDIESVKNAISEIGYRVLAVSLEPYEKKSLFSIFKK